MLDANFSTPSTDTTTNGSGSRKRFRFGSPLALRTGGTHELDTGVDRQARLTRNPHSPSHDFWVASMIEQDVRRELLATAMRWVDVR